MTVPPARQEDLELALSMAAAVAPLALEWFSSADLGVQTKHDESLVTQADLAIERRLRQLVTEADPMASIVGEEAGVTAGEDTRKWFLDPIDGTISFVRGVPLFSTLIALHDEHGPAVGVISLPALNEVIAAGRGLGCSFNGNACSVSAQSTTEDSLITTWGYELWPPALLGYLQDAKAQLQGWGDGYGWALVATGRADAVIDFDMKPWDLAPMGVILSEAGGRFTAFDGTDDISKGSGLGTNGFLHQELLSFLHRGSLG